VMVGEFGEVQVMDWGLAKVLADRPAPGEAPGASEGGPESEQGAAESAEQATRPGSVLGTPASASPEQASGAVEHLNERAGVFGLGAILCEVLTGLPPYVGQDLFQVRRKAARADLADARARLEGCGADAELVGLALACLAPRAEDRPRDAGA